MAKHKDDPPQRLKYLRISTAPNTSTHSAQRNSMGGVGPCAEHVAALITCWRGNGLDSPRCADAVAIVNNCAAAMKQQQQSQSKANPIMNINKTLHRYFKHYLQ